MTEVYVAFISSVFTHFAQFFKSTHCTQNFVYSCELWVCCLICTAIQPTIQVIYQQKQFVEIAQVERHRKTESAPVPNSSETFLLDELGRISTRDHPYCECKALMQCSEAQKPNHCPTNCRRCKAKQHICFTSLSLFEVLALMNIQILHHLARQYYL